MSRPSHEEALSIARSLPKAELHLHLDGSLLPSFLFRRAEARGCRSDLPKSPAELRRIEEELVETLGDPEDTQRQFKAQIAG